MSIAFYNMITAKINYVSVNIGASNGVQVLTNQKYATPTFQDFEIDLVNYTEHEGLDNGMMFREGVITYK